MPRKCEVASIDDNQERILEKYGTSVVSKVPIALPIVLEVGSDLADIFEGDLPDNLNPAAKLAIIKMRDDLERQFGVKIPGVRVRKNGHLGADYNIQIFECAIERGILNERGNDSLIHLIEKLQQVLKKRLGEFLGVAETATLLDLEKEKSPHCREIVEDPEKLGFFTQVLRRLVREQVPIVQLGLIAGEFLRVPIDKINLIEITENVRALPEVRNTLLGNNAKSDFIETVPELEYRFQNAMVNLLGMQRLVFNIDHIKYISNLIRVAIAELSNPVIVVKDPKIRPYFRDFLDVEFANVPILVWNELNPECQTQIRRKLNWGG